MEVEIEVWICPTPGCGNYYAATSAGDLTTQFNERKDSTNRVIDRWPRSRCAYCRSAGRGEVDRVRKLATVTV